MQLHTWGSDYLDTTTKWIFNNDVEFPYPIRFASKPVTDADPDLSRLDRMDVPVLNAIGGFARQAGRIVVGDVCITRIEEVEDVGPDAKWPSLPIQACIDEGRGIGLLRAILDQRRGTEMAKAG